MRGRESRTGKAILYNQDILAAYHFQQQGLLLLVGIQRRHKGLQENNTMSQKTQCAPPSGFPSHISFLLYNFYKCVFFFSKSSEFQVKLSTTQYALEAMRLTCFIWVPRSLPDSIKIKTSKTRQIKSSIIQTRQ